MAIPSSSVTVNTINEAQLTDDQLLALYSRVKSEVERRKKQYKENYDKFAKKVNEVETSKPKKVDDQSDIKLEELYIRNISYATGKEVRDVIRNPPREVMEDYTTFLNTIEGELHFLTVEVTKVVVDYLLEIEKKEKINKNIEMIYETNWNQHLLTRSPTRDIIIEKLERLEDNKLKKEACPKVKEPSKPVSSPLARKHKNFWFFDDKDTGENIVINPKTNKIRGMLDGIMDGEEMLIPLTSDLLLKYEKLGMFFEDTARPGFKAPKKEPCCRGC